jgi:site-specific recombinase XerD
MAVKTQKQVVFSKTGGHPTGRPQALREPLRLSALDPVVEQTARTKSRSATRRSQQTRLQPLINEWLLDLRVLGRSPRTLRWYSQKMGWYLAEGGGVQTLEDFTAFELKRYLAFLQERGLAENSVKHAHTVAHAFASWAACEGHPVDPALLRVRAPKVAETERETFSAREQEVVLSTAALGWPRIALQILLGTGMRVSELCALVLEDIEEDDDSSFLKVRRGKGAKFRRVPISRHLQRELARFLNRGRTTCRNECLLVLQDGRSVSVECVTQMLRRLKKRVGFSVHAHKFRHTFATEYLRRGGDIERLRRILGHTSYAMVMRYVHMNKTDLARDIDLRTPF